MAATYAVIETGGKQYKVEKGDVIEVERLSGDEHVFTPVMLVSRGKLRASPKELEGTTVTAKVVGDARGPKITGFTYKAKTNNRRRWGHRQALTRIEITDIRVTSKGSGGSTKSASTSSEESSSGDDGGEE